MSWRLPLVSELENFAASAAAFIPDRVREYLGLQTVAVVLGLLLFWQLARAVSNVGRYSEDHHHPRAVPRMAGWLSRFFPARLAIIANVLVGLLLVVLTVQVWAMPAENLTAFAGRVLLPYESVQVLGTGLFGMIWWAGAARRRRRLERELDQQRV